MLRPRIKHKVSELEETKKYYNSKKSLIFTVIITVILFLGGVFINNYINYTVFHERVEARYKGLVFKLETDKDSYQQGEKVIIKVTVHNQSNKSVSIDFLTSEMVYYTVYSYVDLGLTRFYYKVWTTKPSIPEVPKTYRLSLKPGERVNIVKVWDQVDMNGDPVKTGRYKFVAELNTVDKLSLSK